MSKWTKVFILTTGALLLMVAALWLAGNFALGFGWSDLGPNLLLLGKTILHSPVGVYQWFKPAAGQGAAGGFVALCLFAGWFSTARSTEMGLLFTGAGLILFYPAFAIADAPLAGSTWRAMGLYFGGWAAALASVAVLLGGLTAAQHRFGR